MRLTEEKLSYTMLPICDQRQQEQKTFAREKTPEDETLGNSTTQFCPILGWKRDHTAMLRLDEVGVEEKRFPE